MVLEASFSYDFNPMVKRSCMSVKFGLVTAHGVLCVKILDLLKVGPMQKRKKKGNEKGDILENRHIFGGYSCMVRDKLNGAHLGTH